MFLQKNTNLPIKQVKVNKDNITVKCNSKEDTKRIEEILTKNLNAKYNFEIEKKKQKPRIKAVGIENEFSANEMENDVNNRSFYFCESKCKILHIYKNKNSQKYTAIIELTSELYTLIFTTMISLFL